MEKRTIIAIVLSLVVVVGYQFLFMKPKLAHKPVPAQQARQEAQPGTSAGPAPAQSTLAPAALAAVKRAETERLVTIQTPLYSAVFSTRGGTLKSFKLKNYGKTFANRAEYVEMVNFDNTTDYPLSVSFPESSINIPADAEYGVESGSIDLDKQGTPGRLTFFLDIPGKMKVEKVLTFYPDKYAFDLDIKVHNASGANLNEKAFLTWNQYVDPKMEEDSYGHSGPIYYYKNSAERENQKKLEGRKAVGPDVSWGGYESKYFIASMIPKQPSLTNLSFGKDQNNMISISLDGPKDLVPSGQDGVFGFTVYVGPKDYDLLKAQNVGLENSIDYGWVKWLALPLLITLKYLNQFVHNYGIAIIIITTLIKIIFWPLGNKSYKSMKEMQSLQPKISELREKFKNDKTKLNQEVMQLYKKYKVNPMSGCLPMVIQIPVFFGLYKALLYSIELRHAPFAFWIQDLSAKDPYYITPIIMGATMLWQQKLSPQVGDPMQAKLMLLMPIVFTFLFLNFPSGLVIYWLFNNILSIGQQYYINKRYAK